MATFARSIVAGIFLAAMASAAVDARQPENSLSRQGIGAELPSDWTVEPSDPQGQGIRFVSPDGSAWVALSKELAKGSIAAHMDSVALVDGERVTYLRRGRSWIVVSGHKDDRIFYRKSMLACSNTLWHQIAFEYPAAEKRAFDRLVTRISRALGAHRSDGCEVDRAAEY